MADVVTGEAVVLEVPCARFPSRALALVVDLVIQAGLLFILLLAAGAAAAHGRLGPASGAAVTLAAMVLAIVVYPVAWETVTRGRSPGKFALGLRVVGDDGGPERFRQALVRGLAAAVEIWGFAGCPALICSLLSARGKRLGDVFAGTFVIQQRLPSAGTAAARPALAAGLIAWAAGLEMSGLSDQTAETARRYLARLPELTPDARTHLGERIASAVKAQVSPPPPPLTPPESYLGAVLAERRRREEARLSPTPSRALPPSRTGWPAAPSGQRTDWIGAAWEGEASPAPDRTPEPSRAPGGFVPPV